MRPLNYQKKVKMFYIYKTIFLDLLHIVSKTFRKQNIEIIQKNCKSLKMIKYENLSKCGLVQQRITGIWTTLESQDFLSQGHSLRLFYKKKKIFKNQ